MQEHWRVTTGTAVVFGEMSVVVTGTRGWTRLNGVSAPAPPTPPGPNSFSEPLLYQVRLFSAVPDA